MIMIISIIIMIMIISIMIISILILVEELSEAIVGPRCLRKHYEHVLTIYQRPNIFYNAVQRATVRWFT